MLFFPRESARQPKYKQHGNCASQSILRPSSIMFCTRSIDSLRSISSTVCLSRSSSLIRASLLTFGNRRIKVSTVVQQRRGPEVHSEKRQRVTSMLELRPTCENSNKALPPDSL